MKESWAGINSLIRQNSRNSKAILELKQLNGQTTRDPSQLPNVINDYFSTVGSSLASVMRTSNRHFSDYLPPRDYLDSFFFNPVIESEVESEILMLPLNKTSALYSFPSKLLKLARHFISRPIAN